MRRLLGVPCGETAFRRALDSATARRTAGDKRGVRLPAAALARVCIIGGTVDVSPRDYLFSLQILSSRVRLHVTVVFKSLLLFSCFSFLRFFFNRFFDL